MNADKTTETPPTVTPKSVIEKLVNRVNMLTSYWRHDVWGLDEEAMIKLYEAQCEAEEFLKANREVIPQADSTELPGVEIITPTELGKMVFSCWGIDSENDRYLNITKLRSLLIEHLTNRETAPSGSDESELVETLKRIAHIPDLPDFKTVEDRLKHWLMTACTYRMWAEEALNRHLGVTLTTGSKDER